MRVQSPASAELRTRPDPDPGLNRARRGRKARQIVQIFRAPARPTARHSRAPARPMPSYPKVTATATDAAALTGPHPPGRRGPGKVRLDERLQPLHGDRGGPGAQRALHQPEVDGADDWALAWASSRKGQFRNPTSVSAPRRSGAKPSWSSSRTSRSIGRADSGVLGASSVGPSAAVGASARPASAALALGSGSAATLATRTSASSR